MKDIIQQRYGETARSGLSTNQRGVRAVAEAFGYTAEELESIPAEANMGLSCGNPLATAHIREGEVVVDLGSGGGLDVFLAARKVGPNGKVYGIDMTPEMLELARKNAEKSGLKTVEFLEGQIDSIPMPDASADLVISNCVINLAPDKERVFREIFRILKPGGRLAVSDIALKRTLPQDLAESAAALVGCIAGAISIADYEQGLQKVGFSDIAVIDSGADLNAYAEVETSESCCAPSRCREPSDAQPLHQGLSGILRKYDINSFAASVKVLAGKW